MNAHAVELGAVVLVVYTVWAYTHPYHQCPLCKGTGRNGGSTKHRWGKCWRCRGAREVKTLGAQLLHRAVRATVRYNRDRKEK